jgi:sulfate/thiosulfate-binding protein
MRRISVLVGFALALPALAAGATKDVKLTLVAYSTPKDAYAKLIPAFQETSAGKSVSFDQSYGASGDQARAIAAGLPADVVELSLEPDITFLVKKHLVGRGWNKDKWHGMVTRSVVVFVVRGGNPKHLRTWSDLLKPGVQVVTPNPFTSGGARWNVMAAYGGVVRAGKTRKQAITYLTKLFQKHVAAQPASAREALQTFLAGRGDVLLSYENEAILAKQKGQSVNFVAPKATILIENPIAVTSTTKHATQAKAFVRFLHTARAQKIFAQAGYRPVVKSVARRYSFALPKQLFTIANLGGWQQVEKTFFDPHTGVMAKIEQGVGG